MMNAKACVLVLVMTAGFVFANPNWSQRVDRLQEVMATTDSLLACGRADEVVVLLPPLLNDDRLGAEVLWPLEQRLGLAYQALGRFEEALPHLERAVLWAQQDPVNHRNLAHLLLQLGKRGRAFSEYRDACSLALDDWSVRVEFGHVLLDYEQIDRAASILEEAETRCSDCPDVARALVRLSLVRRDYNRALPYITILHGSNPTSETREQMALILLKTGQPEAARAMLLNLWPDALSANERRIVLEADQQLGDDSRALALAVSGGVEDDGADFWGLASLICFEAGEDESALFLVERAIALAPQSAALRNNRVAMLLKLGRREDADVEWGIVLQLDPSLVDNRRD